MKLYKVSIRANPSYPYFMTHRMDDTSLDEWEKLRGRIIERQDVALEDLKRAEFHAYRNADGELYIPSDMVRGSLVNAGKYVKSKVGNAKRSMSNIVAGMFYVKAENGNPDELPIGQEFEIDKRSAVNHNNKARVISIRPKWKDWHTSFMLLVDNDTVTDDTVKTIIEYAGSYVGIGSFRPEHKGQFGRFLIDEFRLVDTIEN